jgi:hypothetical protein
MVGVAEHAKAKAKPMSQSLVLLPLGSTLSFISLQYVTNNIFTNIRFKMMTPLLMTITANKRPPNSAAGNLHMYDPD